MPICPILFWSLKLFLIFDLVDILKSSICENGRCYLLVLLFFSALNSFALLSSTSQFLLPTFYCLTTRIRSRSYQLFITKAFWLETIAPEIKPCFKYRYIRWRNKLRPNWHLLTVKFACDLSKMGKCLEMNAIAFVDHYFMHSCFLKPLLPSKPRCKTLELQF